MPDWNEETVVKAGGKEVTVTLAQLRDAFASVEEVKGQAELIAWAKAVRKGMETDPNGTAVQLYKAFGYDVDDEGPGTGQQPPATPPGSPPAGDFDAKFKAMEDRLLAKITGSVEALQSDLYMGRATEKLSKQEASILAKDPSADINAIRSRAAEEGMVNLESAHKLWRADNPPKIEEAPQRGLFGKTPISSGAPKAGVKPTEGESDDLDSIIRTATEELHASGQLVMNGGRLELAVEPT